MNLPDFKLDPEILREYEEAQKKLDPQGNIFIDNLVEIATHKTNPVATEVFNDALNFRITGIISPLLMKNLRMWVIVVGDLTVEAGQKLLVVDRKSRLVHLLVPFSIDRVRRDYFSTIVKKILGSDWGVDYDNGIMALNAHKRRTTAARRKKAQSKRANRTKKSRK